MITKSIEFSIGLKNVGRFDFSFNVPRGTNLNECLDIGKLMKSALHTQWDTFVESKEDSIEQVLGRCLLATSIGGVAKTEFDIDLFWCLEEDYAREVAGKMNVEITEEVQPEAWVELGVEFHSVLSQGFFHDAKVVYDHSEGGATANYKKEDLLYNAIQPGDNPLGLKK